jgi:hypothetical protein
MPCAYINRLKTVKKRLGLNRFRLNLSNLFFLGVLAAVLYGSGVIITLLHSVTSGCFLFLLSSWFLENAVFLVVCLAQLLSYL